MENKITASYNAIQQDLVQQIKLENHFKIEDIKLIAGVDLAYWEEAGKTIAVCCICVVDFLTKEVVEIQSLKAEVKVPYIPGYLSFRELPLIIETFKLLTSDPDMIMFDGNGYLHPRNMGIATHASFHLNKPTIGMAKTYLKIDSVDFDMPANEAGAFTNIVINNIVYGRALRTHKDVKPIFISCGNWIDIDTATAVTLALINKESRLPIPVRLADLETKKKREHFR
ncbi:endonuclease V [Paenibacillus sp. BIHB 4019]|uniref:Endonuclease V n=1 Tax=Paenibacillus sp. BIHB 4019 TaxID=1870819 RepID=A0A1B2DI76_9BACL|nr:endonuclease V [Paenibacillus sp. BIHB 4019]ANY67393.1 endonuclease V [Paenibacillus sp. BIHB 4019]